MKNLAGNKNCDIDIIEELQLAEIEVVPFGGANLEVPSTVGGRIFCDGKEILLHRAWYYWMANGPVPLELARKIYAIGAKDIRVGGHCGCPSPDEHLSHRSWDSRKTDVL